MHNCFLDMLICKELVSTTQDDAVGDKFQQINFTIICYEWSLCDRYATDEKSIIMACYIILLMFQVSPTILFFFFFSFCRHIILVGY